MIRVPEQLECSTLAGFKISIFSRGGETSDVRQFNERPERKLVE